MSVIYVVLAILFFLPSVDLPYKMCYPLALLSLCAWLWRPWPIALAMSFSLVGDTMGVMGNFPLQLTAFALCHVCLLLYFFRETTAEDRRAHRVAGWVSIGVAVLAMLIVVPMVPVAWLKAAVVAYAVVIVAMAYGASCMGKLWLTLGAWLFVISDCILGCNRFVVALPYATWLIMVPYFTAQWLIFLNADE